MPARLLRNNVLDGIRVADACYLLLIRNDFYSNGGFGLRILSGACPLEETSSENGFSGLITGYGNRLGSSTSSVANLLGSYCPEDLTFLTQPNSQDE